MRTFIGEKKHVTSDKEKHVYYYYDKSREIEQISREVYKKRDEEIHHPRGYRGGPKYKNIKRFVYRGFEGKLPVGVLKKARRGWGFTSAWKAFAKYVDETIKVKEVVIVKTGLSVYNIQMSRLTLTADSMAAIQRTLANNKQKHALELANNITDLLHSFFPEQIAKSKRRYIPNSISSSLSSWGNQLTEFSDADKDAIRQLFEKLSLRGDLLNASLLAETKQVIDSRYLQETLTKFNKIMEADNDTPALEKKWQVFLRDNSWIFNSIFAQPVILHKEEAYVGGKNLDNRNGKVTDFLIKNSLSNNVAFLEIKTHKAELVDSKLYRGNDVYGCSRDLAGAVVQVLNQRDNFQKEFHSHTYKNKSSGILETFNSKCVVLAGQVADLDNGQLSSFELFRNNSKDVEILTFDELCNKVERIQQLVKGETGKRTTSKPPSKNITQAAKQKGRTAA